jgi:phage protein D
MTSAVPIYTDYDFYVPAFEVKIKGRSLDRDVLRDVIQVSYTDSLGQMDSCELTINNWDAEARTFKYSDSDIFDPGGQIELYMGYYDRGGLTLMLRGTIVSLSPDFPAGGQPTLQVRALNQLYRLHFKQVTEPFRDKTDSQIAQAILSKINQEQPGLGLELETRPANQQIETPHEYILINNDYPIIFLMERARRNGYDIYIEDVDQNGRIVSKLHFHPPEGGPPATYKLEYGRTLISFKPTLKTAKQVSKVTVRGWDVRQAEAFQVSVTRDDLPTRGLPRQEDMQAVDSALSGSEIVIADQPVTSRQEAEQLARDHLQRLANDLVTGSGSTVGLPELRAGRPVYICGLGKRYSGRFVINTTTHSISDGGYTTTFEARLEELKSGGGKSPCEA